MSARLPVKRFIPGKLICSRARRVETEIAGVSGNYDRFSMARHISRHAAADNKVTTETGVNVMRGPWLAGIVVPLSSLVARR